MPRNPSPKVVNRAVLLYELLRERDVADMESLLRFLRENGENVSYSALYHTLTLLERSGVVDRKRFQRRVYWYVKKNIDNIELRSLLSIRRRTG